MCKNFDTKYKCTFSYLLLDELRKTMDILTAMLITLVILLLLNSVVEFAQGIWGFLVKLCKFKNVDLRKKYGNWAGNVDL